MIQHVTYVFTDLKALTVELEMGSVALAEKIRKRNWCKYIARKPIKHSSAQSQH